MLNLPQEFNLSKEEKDLVKTYLDKYKEFANALENNDWKAF